jgi:multiple sugar transport system ATP-binding protein
MSAVTFDEVTKQFGEVTAVDRFSLDIADGEFMVLLGPSGCGKSTALRMIAGLEEVSSGTLTIGERVVNHVPPKERDIAMVFQSYALYPHMSVAKNIESPLVANRANRQPPAERTRRINEAAEILGLVDYLDRKPGELSGGPRQRVALARAIVRDPEVFLMDEPLSNLDAKLRTQTRLELVELHRRLGTTFVYVTHDQVEAMTMADRIAVINDGRLQQVGAPQAVYERPANLFVAAFIGSPPMNIIEGTVVSDCGTPLVRTAAGPLPLPDSPGFSALAGADEGRAVIAGIRPEHLVIGTPDDGLVAKVENVELLGHERHLICHVAASRMTVRQPNDSPPPAVGEKVGLRGDAVGVHLFDASSLERLGE